MYIAARAVWRPRCMRTVVTVTHPFANQDIARITLDNPPVNTLTQDMIVSLTQTFRELESTSCKGVILSSTGRVFSAGLDLKMLHNPSQKSLVSYWDSFQDLYLAMYGSRKAIVADIRGHAIAAGCIISLCADARIINNTSKIGLNEAAFGVIPTNWICQLMIDAVGRNLGYKSVCQGKIYSAAEALDMGLVDQIVEDNNDMDAAVVAECERWIGSPGFPATKEQLHRPGLDSMLKNRHMETDLFVTRILSTQTQELLGNYLESLKKK